jgi:hypothetical protein
MNFWLFSWSFASCPLAGLATHSGEANKAPADTERTR